MSAATKRAPTNGRAARVVPRQLPAGDPADPQSMAGRTLDEVGFADKICKPGDPPRVFRWPVEKLRRHPKNRDLDEAHVEATRERLRTDGQLNAIECRCVPEHWHHRDDEWVVPDGHLQILRGAHRTEAARLESWNEVDVVLRSPVDDREALQVLARSDDQKQWTLIEKGHLALAMRETGDTLPEIAAFFGVKDKATVSHWIGIAERVPACWHEVVAPGVRRPKSGDLVQIEASWLRCLEKYPPELAVAVFGVFEREELKKPEPGEWTISAKLFAECVESTVDECGPIDHRPRREYCPNRGQWGEQVSYGRLFALTPEIEAELGIVEIPAPKNPRARGGGKRPKTVRVATNVELFERLNRPLVKQLKAGKLEPDGSKPKPKPKPGEKRARKKKPAKPANETKRQREAREAREAKEAAARKRKADKKLGDALRSWRLRFVRCLCARALAEQVDVGDFRIVPALWHLAGDAHSARNAWRSDPVSVADYRDAAIAIQEAKHHPAKSPASKPARKPRTRARVLPVQGLAHFLQVLRDDREDETTAGLEFEAELLRLFLWPQSDLELPTVRSDLVAGPGKVPVDFAPVARPSRSKSTEVAVHLPAIDPDDVDELAGLLGVKVLDGWKRSAKPGTQERVLFEDLVGLHNREQIDALAKHVLAGPLAGKGGARKAERPDGSHPGGAAHLDVAGSRTRAIAIERLVHYHKPAAPVRLPKILSKR